MALNLLYSVHRRHNVYLKIIISKPKQRETCSLLKSVRNSKGVFVLQITNMGTLSAHDHIKPIVHFCSCTG